MIYFLIDDSLVILQEWSEFVSKFIKDDDEIFIIHCHGFKKNENDIFSELITNCSYLKARNKETLSRHLIENSSKNKKSMIIADLHLFYDTGFSYQNYGLVKSINDLFGSPRSDHTKVFIYDDEIVKDILSRELNPMYKPFKRIEDIF